MIRQKKREAGVARVERADESQAREPRKRISRRDFLKGAAVVATAAAATSACTSLPDVQAQAPVQQAQAPVQQTQLPTQVQYPEIQYPPSVPPSPGRLRFFSPDEARMVEALTARILPGTADDPGAREAGVVVYIDYLLAMEEGFGERTFREPPYAQTYEGDQPPAQAENAEFPTLWIPADQIKRYGYQSRLTPREVYRLALPAIDSYCQKTYGGRFVDLSEPDQDKLVDDLYNNRVTGFDQFSPQAFFHVLRRQTDEGMFSDPAYGGNRDLLGWTLIGYPGAQRAYTPEEIVSDNPPRRAPQALDQLEHFNPGQRTGTGQVILPVSGSEPYPGIH